MAKYSHITRGGVGAPVGLTVFKTAGGSLGAVPGGFDSHTPLPGSYASRPVTVGNTSHVADDVPFGVLTAITITPQQGPSGTSITASGTGFVPAEQVALKSYVFSRPTQSVSGTGFVPAEQVTIEWVDPTTNRGHASKTISMENSR